MGVVIPRQVDLGCCTRKLAEHRPVRESSGSVSQWLLPSGSYLEFLFLLYSMIGCDLEVKTK